MPEKVEMLRLWMRGLTRSAIARETGRSVTAVCRWVNRWRREGHVNSRPRTGRPGSAGATHKLPVSHTQSHYCTQCCWNSCVYNVLIGLEPFSRTRLYYNDNCSSSYVQMEIYLKKIIG